MTLKKKLLIALLSTTCVAAGVTGLAACKDKPKGEAPYTVSAVDQNGNAVEGVVFRIGYYDAENFQTVYVQKDSGKKDNNGNPIMETIIATTGKDGKATFKDFKPEEGIEYSVYLAEVDDGRAYPYGYSVEEASVNFDENWKATYSFKYVPSSYTDNLTYALEYKRLFDDSEYAKTQNEDDMKYVEQGSKTLTLNLKKDVHSYFSFLPYKELGFTGVSDPNNQDAISAQVYYNQLWGTKAAAGVYTVTVTSSSNTAVNLYSFNGSGYIVTDDNGIPTNKIQSPAASKTVSITLELTVYGNQSRATQYFGLYAASDCNVTITVSRDGDAEEPPEVSVTKIPVPANITKYSEQNGNLTLMTTNGTIKAVKGDDGYYHVGTKTGPQLLVTLTKALPRVGELSIKDLGDSGKNDLSATAYVFSEYNENNILTASYDYTDLVNAYIGNVNSDGVYPVNDGLYDFLQLFAAAGQMQAQGEYSWLAPCQYYAPAEGMDVTGAGTEADPYILLTTTNKLVLNGSEAYAKFTAIESGVYTFKTGGCTLSVNGTTDKFYDDDMLVHVILAENESVVFTTEGTGNTTVTVENVTANQYSIIEAVFGDATDAKGMSASSAIQLNKTGYNVYKVDKNVNDGVWVCVKPMIAGNSIDYTFKIKGSSIAQIEYDGEIYKQGEVLNLTCQVGTTYYFKLTAKNGEEVVDGVYAIEWETPKTESSGGGAMNLGKNEVYISASDAFNGIECTFTSEEGGSYIIKADSEDAYIFGSNDNSFEINGTEPYQFTLEAGGTLTFYCAGPIDTAVGYNVIIQTNEITGDPAFNDEGGVKHVTLTEDNGVDFIFMSTTGGTYTISVPTNAEAIINNNSASQGAMAPAVINTAASKYSYEFTLEAGGYISFTAILPVETPTNEFDITIARKPA